VHLCRSPHFMPQNSRAEHMMESRNTNGDGIRAMCASALRREVQKTIGAEP
jgi:hypothetical protein